MTSKCEYLLPFKNYAKLFILKIHPDKHHGYPNVQKINTLTTHVVNSFFKFEDDLVKKHNELHNLSFFIWNNDKSSHTQLSYKLIFNWPFDDVSGRSVLGLFEAAQIPVDFSIIDSIPNNKPKEYKIETPGKDWTEGIKNSCLNLDFDDLSFDAKEVLDFIRLRPYIQFEGYLLNDKLKFLRLCMYLMHCLRRLENKIRSQMPIIIISDKFVSPQFSNGLIQLPSSSNFKGNDVVNNI